MNIQDCIQFASENPICFLATAEGGQPRVRTLALEFANENGFYFAVLSPKRLFQQLKANPRVEVCFYNQPAELMYAKQMRVTGEIELIHDPDLQQQVAKEGAFLEELTGKQLATLWEVFRIHTGEAFFFTLADTLREAELERIRF